MFAKIFLGAYAAAATATIGAALGVLIAAPSPHSPEVHRTSPARRHYGTHHPIARFHPHQEFLGDTMYTFTRDKITGTATVTFDPATGSRQKADSIGRAAFHAPAKFVRQEATQTPRITQRNPLRFKVSQTVTRHYAVPNW